MLDAVLTLFTGIVIAAVSSWITVQLSLQRFRSERWWERKVQAYERVIGALHDSKAFSDDHLGAEMRGSELTEEQDKELRSRSKVAHQEIAKAIDIGAFLLSDNALARLKHYRREEDKVGESRNWFEYLEADWVATDSCLTDIIKIAKKDLAIE